MSLTIPQFSSVDEALIAVLTNILRDGSATSPRGLATLEVLGHAFRILDPRARRVTLPARGWKESLAVGEFAWHLSQSDDVGFLAYYAPSWEQFSEDGRRIASSCYGRRIFGGVYSQWQRALDVLSSDPATRRAVLSLDD